MLFAAAAVQLWACVFLHCTVYLVATCDVSLSWVLLSTDDCLQVECSRNSTTVRALMRSWRAGSPAHAARALGSAADGLLELAPALRDISRPAAVRAVNAQLLTRDEDRVLGHVVSVVWAHLQSPGQHLPASLEPGHMHVSVAVPVCQWL